MTGIIVGGLAILIAAAGMKCTKFMSEDKQIKGKVALAGGIMFLIAGVWMFNCFTPDAQPSIQHMYRSKIF